MEKAKLVLKGVAMGLADVVPGVSGGTLALILGIYVRFIDAIRSLNVRWVVGFVRWARAGFAAADRGHFLDPILAIHWSFLVPLGAGIASAIVVGSRVIPPLMVAYPEATYSFFFGLILASIWLPIREMRRRGPKEAAAVVLATLAAFFLVGTSAQPVLQFYEKSATEDLAFEAFTKQHPSVYTPEQLYCPRSGAGDNRALREQLRADPGQAALAAHLEEVCVALAATAADAHTYAETRSRYHLARKDPNNPFHQVVIPAGTPVHVPKPAHWFLFLAGFIAICAMVLPGISGSFILLVLGAYYFVLTSLKGTLESLVRLDPAWDAIGFVAVFSVGALLGLVSFARVMSWLFRQYGSVTLAAMVGLMLGCLRVIWPFKVGDMSSGVVANVMPSGWGAAGVPLVCFAAGVALIAGLTLLEIRAERAREARVSHGG